MPVYEYECEHCGVRFERIQSIKDEPIRVCPECSGTVHKVFHPAGIIFKGSGWYITDSRKSSSGSVAGESKSESKGDKQSGAREPKSESKSEKPSGASGTSGEKKD